MGEYKTVISIGEYMLVILLWDYPIANKREMGLELHFQLWTGKRRKTYIGKNAWKGPFCITHIPAYVHISFYIHTICIYIHVMYIYIYIFLQYYYDSSAIYIYI